MSKCERVLTWSISPDYSLGVEIVEGRNGGSALTVEVAHVDAVTLAHALVAEITARGGIRALIVKGPVSVALGLRTPRVSADADVLVAPQDFERFCGELLAHGWHPPLHRDPPRVMLIHSKTFTHDDWPCAIDVHHYFPGLFGESEEVFDRLWTTREVVAMGHRQCLVPSRAGMTLFVALHALRAPSEPRSGPDLDVLRSVMDKSFRRDEQIEFLEIARIGRAQWVLSPLLDELDWEWSDDATASEKAIWRDNQLDVMSKSALVWEREFRSALVGGALLRIVRAVWVPRTEMPRPRADTLPTVRAHWGYQIERWKRGVKIAHSRRRGR